MMMMTAGSKTKSKPQMKNQQVQAVFKKRNQQTMTMGLEPTGKEFSKLQNELDSMRAQNRKLKSDNDVYKERLKNVGIGTEIDISLQKRIVLFIGNTRLPYIAPPGFYKK